MTNRKPRSYLFQYIDVLDQHTRELLGYLADVSEDGLMFIAQQSILPGEVLDICLETNIDEQMHSPVKLQIVVLWNKPNVNPQLTCIGCKIMHVDAENRRLLLKAADAFSFTSEVTIIRTYRDSDERTAISC